MGNACAAPWRGGASLVSHVGHRWPLAPPCFPRQSPQSRARMLDSHASLTWCWCLVVVPEEKDTAPCPRERPTGAARGDRGWAVPRPQRGAGAVPSRGASVARDTLQTSLRILSDRRARRYAGPCAVTRPVCERPHMPSGTRLPRVRPLRLGRPRFPVDRRILSPYTPLIVMPERLQAQDRARARRGGFLACPRIRSSRLIPILLNHPTSGPNASTVRSPHARPASSTRRRPISGMRMGSHSGRSGSMVAYPLAADNVSRPLSFRLRRVKQPVVRSQIELSVPRAVLLACLWACLSRSVTRTFSSPAHYHT